MSASAIEFCGDETVVLSTTARSSRRDTPLLDVKIYTNAFERIENAIFIRSGE